MVKIFSGMAVSFVAPAGIYPLLCLPVEDAFLFGGVFVSDDAFRIGFGRLYQLRGSRSLCGNFCATF